MEELTVQELLDYLSNIEDKSKVIQVVDDNDNKSSLYIKKETKHNVFLGQVYED